MEKMPGASSPAYLKNLYCTLKNAAFAFFYCEVGNTQALQPMLQCLQ